MPRIGAPVFLETHCRLDAAARRAIIRSNRAIGQSMTLTWKDRPDGVRVLYLEGALDAAGVARIEPQFAGCTVPARLDVIVDLAAVTFAGSAAARMLAGAARTMRQNNNQLTLIQPQASVRRALEQAGLAELLAADDKPRAQPA